MRANAYKILVISQAGGSGLLGRRRETDDPVADMIEQWDRGFIRSREETAAWTVASKIIQLDAPGAQDAALAVLRKAFADAQPVIEPPRIDRFSDAR
jgi:hypothetical protein